MTQILSPFLVNFGLLGGPWGYFLCIWRANSQDTIVSWIWLPKLLPNEARNHFSWSIFGPFLPSWGRPVSFFWLPEAWQVVWKQRLRGSMAIDPLPGHLGTKLVHFFGPFLANYWSNFGQNFVSNSLHMMEMVAACNQAQSPYDRGYPGPVIHNFAISSFIQSFLPWKKFHMFLNSMAAGNQAQSYVILSSAVVPHIRNSILVFNIRIDFIFLFSFPKRDR